MNLILIGYRGTGKSTIAERLARELSLEYVSLDEEIVRRAGAGIPEIVERHGWDRFRDLEEEVVREVTARDGQVLDTGGGAILREENRRRLRAAGLVVLLEAAVEDICRRIGGDTERPSLTGTKSVTAEVEEVLAVRRPLYREAAHHTVDTSRLSVEEAVREIVRVYRSAAGG